MKSRIIVVGTLAASALATAACWAQYYGGGYVDNRASTPGQAAAYGMSSVISSQGQYNLQTSQAAINLTQAQRQDIENRQEATKAYFEMRRMNREYRAAEERPPATREQLVRFAQAGKPQRLSPSELDSIHGRISWPLLLRDAQYDSTRAQLEQLFAARSKSGAASAEQYMEIDRLCKSVLDGMKSQIASLPPNEYVAAKKFMASLAYEARLPST